MEPLKIAERLKELFPDEVLDVREFRGQVSVTLRKNRILDIARFLHDDPELYFDYLMDVCGVRLPWEKRVRFEVVYHLYSIKHRLCPALSRQRCPENDPTIDSVTSVWIGANWHERECYDLYGIKFMRPS